MNLIKWLLLVLIVLLCSCESKNPYQQKNGRWYYDEKPLDVEDPSTFSPLNNRFARNAQHGWFRDEIIPASEGVGFEALNENYARDNKQVYYCESYRDSQDYFTTLRNRISIVAHADPGSFRYLQDDYARDATKLFYQGKHVAVKHLKTFTVLEYGFARDSLRGYYAQTEIAGSDGPTFSALDDHYSRDRLNVYYSTIGPERSAPVTYVIRGAEPGSFSVLGEGYAADAKQAYYEKEALAAVQDFMVLSYGYAKNRKQVFYRGKQVAGADAPSFRILGKPGDTADARDTSSQYQQGRRNN